MKKRRTTKQNNKATRVGRWMEIWTGRDRKGGRQKEMQKMQRIFRVKDNAGEREMERKCGIKAPLRRGK